MGLLLGEVSYCRLVCISVCQFRLCYFWDLWLGLSVSQSISWGLGCWNKYECALLRGFLLCLCVSRQVVGCCSLWCWAVCITEREH